MGTGRYVDFNRDVLTRSHIRMIDVLGTVLFAQLPLLGMNVINMLPAMKVMNQMDVGVPIEELMRQPDFIMAMNFVFCGIAFLDFDSCMDVQCSQGVLQFERLEVVDCCACRNNRRRYCKSDFIGLMY